MNDQEFVAMSLAARYLENKAARIRSGHMNVDKLPPLIRATAIAINSAASVIRGEIAYNNNRMAGETRKAPAYVVKKEWFESRSAPWACDCCGVCAN